MIRLYISYGIPKSASTYAWQLIKKIAIRGGLPIATLTIKSKGRHFAEDYLESLTQEQLQLVREDVGDAPVVIKTHAAGNQNVARLVAEAEALVFASYRDPRDIALSLLDHGVRSRATGAKDFAELYSIADTLTIIENQIARFNGWVESCDPLLIPYDEICFDTRHTIGKIADRIRVEIDVDAILSEFADAKTAIGQFNKGEASRFKREMSPNDSEYIFNRFRDYYRKYFPNEEPGVALGGMLAEPGASQAVLMSSSVRPAHSDSAASLAPSQAGGPAAADSQIGHSDLSAAYDSDAKATAAAPPQPRPELVDRVSAIRWFHQIDLGPLVTPGVKPAANAAFQASVALKDVMGKTVLDVGAWDGYFSFAAEHAGASRVLATDHYCWGGPGWGTIDGFLTAREILNSSVEYEIVDAPEVCQERLGTFDVVLFLGVLYHLKDPFAVLERVAACAAERLVVETETALNDVSVPAARFFPHAELNRRWAPNRCCVEEMLEAYGFGRVEWTPLPWVPQTDAHGRGIFIAHRNG